MTRKLKPLPLFESVEILDAGAEGKCIARVEDKVLFVENAVPGDIADVQVMQNKRRFYIGKIVNLIKPSIHRTEPFCEHFGKCGGCKWQNLSYAKQLEFKQKQVKDNFERIGHLTFDSISPILGSESDRYYRNKLEFTFSNKRWLTSDEMLNPDGINQNGVGFHIPGRFDKVVAVERCFLQDERSNQIRNFVRDFAFENNISFFDLREQHGILRNLIVRNTSIDEWMLIFSFHQNRPEIQLLMNAVYAKFPFITSLMYTINDKRNDTISDLDIYVFKGKPFIIEEMEGLKFQIGPKSFFQTNSKQAYELYKITREYCELKGDELVYDLYTGTGTIANFVAKKAKKVVGVEYVPEAIEDAKINSSINQISNTVFFAGDMKDILVSSFVNQNGKPDVIISDPPRAGMHEDVTRRILEIEPKIIVYVSCNPATQARDLTILEEKYKVTKIQPVDMFPHTHHVENVVQLKRKF